MIKTTKMVDKLEKALTFQTETNILHHYNGILLLKLLWQNQNYQLVMCGSPDWSLGMWLTARDGDAVSGSDPDPSGSISPTSTQTSLIHKFTVFTTYLAWKRNPRNSLFSANLMPDLVLDLGGSCSLSLLCRALNIDIHWELNIFVSLSCCRPNIESSERGAQRILWEAVLILRLTGIF